MKQKTKKPPGQQQQQQQPPQSHSASPPSHQQRLSSPLPVQYASQSAVSRSFFSTEPSGHAQGFTGVRPLTPDRTSPHPALNAGTPSSSSSTVPAYTHPGTAQRYGDPRISPRGFSPREGPGSTAASSSSLVSPTALSRHPSGALAARIQAAELSAAGKFDPASWAAAAAEAIRADKEAAAAAARRAALQEEERRRQQLQEAAAAALAAGRVTSVVSSRGPSDHGNNDSHFGAPQVARDQQQQYWQQHQLHQPHQQQHQQQEDQHFTGGRGWLTPTDGSNPGSPAVAASTSAAAAAAAAAAALAAATAGHSGRTSPHVDPAQIAAEYVELQRQRSQHSYGPSSPSVPGAAHSTVNTSPSMPALEPQLSLRQQYSSSSMSPRQQQFPGRPQSSTSMYEPSISRPASPEYSSYSPSGSRQQQVLQHMWAAGMSDSTGLGPRTLSSGLRSYPTDLQPEGMLVGPPVPGQPQLPPIRTVPPQARAVSPGPAVQHGDLTGSGYMEAVPPGHYQDPSVYPEQYRAVQALGDLYHEGLSQQSAMKLSTLIAAESAMQRRASQSSINTSPAPSGVTETEFGRCKSQVLSSESAGADKRRQQQQQQLQQQSGVGEQMFVPVQQGTGMIGRLLGIYRAGSAGSAAAVISSADVEGGASNTSTRHTPPAQHNTSPAAAGIAGAKDVAVVSIQPRKKKRPKRLLWVAIPLVLLLTVAAVGLGVGLGVSKQQQQQRVAAAAAVANDSNQMLAFRVTVAVPTDQPAVSCAKWFGSSQLLDNYRAVFVSSYASSLDIPPAAFNISSVQCGGEMMTSPAGLAPPTRHLLAAVPEGAIQGHTSAAAGAANAQHTSPKAPVTTTDVVTVFTIPNPANSTDRERLITQVEINSDRILLASLHSFFGQDVTFRSAVHMSSESAARAVPPLLPAQPAAAATPAVAPAAAPQPAELSPAVQQAMAPPPPPPRVAVPAPAVPFGVAAVLPPPGSQQQSGPSSPPPPLYTPMKPQKPGNTSGVLPKPDVLYDTAPTCSAAPTVGNSVLDTEGRLWGWENWQSCAFRGYASVQAEVPDSTWQQAPACSSSPDSSNSVLDSNGMPWGWERGQSCAFRPLGWIPRAQKPQPVWELAPECGFAPSSVTSVSDDVGHLWGWQGTQSCAFRGSYRETNRQGQVTWEAAPTCGFSPSVSNSVVDVDGRLWGWKMGRSCAFKPAQG